MTTAPGLPGLLKRAPLTIAAQSLSSLTNFVTGALALSAGDLESFGQFSIAFQLCIVVIAVGQGSTGAALLVHASGDDEHDVERVRRAAASAALVLGVSFTIVLAIAGVVIGDRLGLLLLISALGAPSLVSQYTLREYRYARQNQLGVVVADLIWLVVVLAVAAVDWTTAWDASSLHYLVAWLVGATLSASPLMISGIACDRAALSHFWRTTGRQAVHLGLESLFARSILAVTLVLTSVIVDETATGSLAAAILLFSPLSVVNTSVTALVVPPEIRRRGIHVVRRSIPIAVIAAVSTITVGWALFVFLLDRSSLAFQPFRLAPNGITNGLFVATLVHYLGLAAWRGPAVGLRIADATKESLDARVRTSIMQWVLPAVGLVIGGLTGGALCLGLATSLGALIAWRRYVGLDTTFRPPAKIAR
jgi:hypothetical protein